MGAWGWTHDPQGVKAECQVSDSVDAMRPRQGLLAGRAYGIGVGLQPVL